MAGMTSMIRESVERALGRRNPHDPRIELRRFPQGPRERLEADLDDVVEVLPFEKAHVEVRLRRARERLEEDLRELAVELAELRLRHRDAPDEERPSRQID